MTINELIHTAWSLMPADGPVRTCSAHRAESWIGGDVPSHLAGPGFAACRVSGDCCAQFGLRVDEQGLWHFTRMNIGREAYARLHNAWGGPKGGVEEPARAERPGRVFDGSWLIAEVWPDEDEPGKVHHRAQGLLHLTFTGRGAARRPAWILEGGGDMSDRWRRKRPAADAGYEDLILDGLPVRRPCGSILERVAAREVPSKGAMDALRAHAALRRMVAM